MVYRDREVSVPWPSHDAVPGHDALPGHGAVLRRDVLDTHLRHHASSAGAHLLMGHEATAPIVERGFVRGASLDADPELGVGPEHVDSEHVDMVRSRFVVVADGANSSFGRALGTTRQRHWPYGIATRTYFASPRSAESWIESVLGIPDRQGNPVTGYGWVIPLGDGTVNVGVAVLSTYRDVRGINALKLLDSFTRSIAERWELDADDQLKAPTRFRIPLGGSVGPTMGPTFLVAGDAAGAANPFNGDGVDAALRCGRLAAEVLDEALTTGNSTALQRYPTLLADEVGQFNKVGRLSARFLGRPAILRPALAMGMHSDRIMGAALRIAANEFRVQQPGGAERSYAIARSLAKFAPSW